MGCLNYNPYKILGNIVSSSVAPVCTFQIRSVVSYDAGGGPIVADPSAGVLCNPKRGARSA